MPEMDMKQKIKEVRDKFLSNNQIEDIRKNITLGVEERLKFLNSEQIKVVELLEEKHRDLDIAIQKQTQQIDDHKTVIQNNFENKISDLMENQKDQSLKFDNQSKKLLSEQTELESRLEKKIKSAAESQTDFTVDSLEQFSKENTRAKDNLIVIEKDFSKKIEENSMLFRTLSEKTISALETNKTLLTKKLEDRETEILKSLVEKFTTFEAEQETLFNKTTESLSSITLSLEKKIETFLENHKTVEEVIDNRLKEFRIAQKAAFEELEAALNLLEKHQDDTLTRFKQKGGSNSSQSQNRQTNLPNSLVKNRGSISYHTDNFSGYPPATANEPVETTTKVTPKKSSMKALKPVVIAIAASLLLIYLMGYFNIEYNGFFDLSTNEIQ